MIGHPPRVQGPRETGRGLVRHVVAEADAAGPGRRDQQRGAGLRQRSAAFVVVAAAAAQIDADVPVRQHLANR